MKSISVGLDGSLGSSGTLLGEGDVAGVDAKLMSNFKCRIVYRIQLFERFKVLVPEILLLFYRISQWGESSKGVVGYRE